MYTPRPEDLKRLENDFVYHAPLASQVPRYETIRKVGGEFAHRLLTLCPPSRELSLALTHIENACFYANASIARNEKAEG